MATSRSTSAAARLSRLAVASFRAIGAGAGHQVPRTPAATGKSIRSDLSAAIVCPRALTSPNGNHISSSTLFSASCLNRVAAPSYSSSSVQFCSEFTEVPRDWLQRLMLEFLIKMRSKLKSGKLGCCKMKLAPASDARISDK
ncbi:hypothetical protein C2S52_007184 [Perilla frutescens var. hirtella]|nr:hypothetical protein C2S51_008682 [Perilla frutescens var. frutescens]KAH6787632.1 hypothetical protein C2S52_007184 [Perilla frutescens var. hirtella]